MKKIIFLIAIIVTVGGGTGSWFYIQNNAKTEVDRFLSRADIRDYIEYEDLEYNPLSGKLVLTDVTLGFDELHEYLGEFPTIKQIEISDFDQQGDIVTNLEISIVGMDVNILELARSTNKALGGSDYGAYPTFRNGDPFTFPANLVSLGYFRESFNLQLNYLHDLETSELEFDFSYGGHNMGSLRYAANFTGVKGALMKEWLDFQKEVRENPMDIRENTRLLQNFTQQNMPKLTRIGIKSLSFGYEDEGLLLKYKNAFLEEMREEEGESWVIEYDKIKDRFERDQKGIRDRKFKSFLSEMNEKLISFLKEPKSFAFSASSKRPIRFETFKKSFKSEAGAIRLFKSLEIELDV